MNKPHNKLRPLLFSALIFAFFFLTGFAKPQDTYLKSATYYSDDWVVNFWNSESDHMEEELRQIRDDGFNSIILVIPWREFQPGPMFFAPYALEKFHKVMDAAASADLSVMLRVGYTWDYAEGDTAVSRVDRISYDKGVRNTWHSYLARLYQESIKHENFVGGFMTWEDFWSFTRTSASYGKSLKGIEYAEKSGYAEYLLDHYSIDELRLLYDDEDLSEDKLYFPSQDSPARRLFYEWYDAFLMQLLEESQESFPNLSFEVRLDQDPIKEPDGDVAYFSHSSTFGAANAPYISAMYSVQMYNEGGNITAAQALHGTGLALTAGKVGGKDIYIDQLLFTDNTIGFENVAQLYDSEKPLYLSGLPSVLRKQSIGYGIWTYRDYANNKLYNSQFALEKKGWDFSSAGARVEERDGSHVAVLYGGGTISQRLQPSNGTQDAEGTIVSFQLEGDKSCVVKVECGDEEATFRAGEKQTVTHNFSGKGGFIRFSLSQGTVYIDNVVVYNHVTEGNLYHMDGTEDFCLEDMRLLNKRMD